MKNVTAAHARPFKFGLVLAAFALTAGVSSAASFGWGYVWGKNDAIRESEVRRTVGASAPLPTDDPIEVEWGIVPDEG